MKRQYRNQKRMVIGLAMLGIAAFATSNLTQKDVHTTAPVSSAMEVHFIDVGQADAILIESENEYMLLDAGNNEDGDEVVNYLKKEGVENLKYVIGTHPHEDHIGGLDDVIQSFGVEAVMLPNKAHTSQTFEDVITAIENKGLSITEPVVGDTYEIGTAKFTIIAPNGDYGDDYNNWSIGIKLENGSNVFVMAGDAEAEAENDIVENGIDIQADVLKIGHHGSDTATSDLFLSKVNPKYAVISVGEGNSYGHPAQSTLDKLKERGVKVFRTDEQGTIIAVSDGTKITFTTSGKKEEE